MKHNIIVQGHLHPAQISSIDSSRITINKEFILMEKALNNAEKMTLRRGEKKKWDINHI